MHARLFTLAALCLPLCGSAATPADPIPAGHYFIELKGDATAAQGSIQIAVAFAFTAVNDGTGIPGRYVGRAQASSHAENGAYGSAAQSDQKFGVVELSLLPTLQPLAARAGATPPPREFDYTGDGTFTLGNPTGTSTITGGGTTARKTHTSAASMPLRCTITGTTVHLTLTSPNGPLQYEGRLRQQP